MQQLHFIAGLPRSGTTLLAALLRQNPAFRAGMSSPLGTVFTALQRALSAGNEAAVWIDDDYRRRLLRRLFTDYYGYAAGVAFDTNRMWPARLPVLASLFPECRVICCVRPLPWVFDSIERLVRSNLELSGIFGFEPGGTVYSRVAGLAAPGGLVGFALEALRDGFYGEHAGRLLLVEYEALARHPRDALGMIYEWLRLPYFDGHQFEAIEQIPGAAEFDARLGTPGLHEVAAAVRYRPRETILPPDLFNSFPAPFWRANNPRVPVVHWVEEPEEPAPEPG